MVAKAVQDRQGETKKVYIAGVFGRGEAKKIEGAPPTKPEYKQTIILFPVFANSSFEEGSNNRESEYTDFLIDEDVMERDARYYQQTWIDPTTENSWNKKEKIADHFMGPRRKKSKSQK